MRRTSRSVEIGIPAGIDISGQRARQLRPEDFDRFDMDLANGPAPMRRQCGRGRLRRSMTRFSVSRPYAWPGPDVA